MNPKILGARVGFTGTRKGMTDKQKQQLKALVQSFHSGEFHYGDCVGADAEAATIFHELNWELCCHPPDNPSLRANLPGKFYHKSVAPPRPYLERNKDIVRLSEVLIAAPETSREELRSGTWATVRYARKKGIPVFILKP